MTFVLHWRRDGAPVAPALVDRLSTGLTRLRDDAVACWTRGPLTILSYEGAVGFSIAEHRTGLVAMLAGRLDDFANVVAQLGGQWELGADPTDAEVLAAAYDKWGESCFEHLLGDYACVIWEPQRRSLLCARDVVGIAPLYYWSDQSEVVLAGQLGGVMSHPSVRMEPNEGYIAEILADDIHSRHETLYQDVWRLVAAHAARFDTSGPPKIRRWGSIEPRETSYRLPDGDCDELYRELLTQAIVDRMRGTGKVGVELSGGLDSSSVAVLAAPIAQEKYAQPLTSYSLVFPGLPCDETQYICAVGAHLSITPTLIPSEPPDHERLRRESRDASALPDVPNGTAFRVLVSAAQTEGITGLLTGQGGDQWFDYYPRFPAHLAAQGRLPSAWNAARRLRPNAPPAKAFAQLALRPLAGSLVRTVYPAFRPPQAPSWLSPSLVSRTNLLDRVRAPDARLSSPLEDRLSVFQCGWEAHVYEAIALAQQRIGIQYRHPFYDARLVAFALSLPETHRWADNQFRTIQRRALGGKLPAVVRERTTKADFSHLFVDHFLAAGGWEAFTGLSIAQDRDWLVPSEIQGMYEGLEEQVASGRAPRQLWPLWHALAVESWHDVASGQGDP